MGQETARKKRSKTYRDPSTDGKRHGGYESEATALEVDCLKQAQSRGQYVGEEENRHAPEHTIRHRRDDSRDLREYADKDEHDTGGDSSPPGRAFGQGDDSVVLGERRVRHRRHETRKHAAEGIGEQCALNAAGVFLVVGREAAHFTGRGHVTDSLDLSRKSTVSFP